MHGMWRVATGHGWEHTSVPCMQALTNLHLQGIRSRSHTVSGAAQALQGIHGHCYAAMASLGNIRRVGGAHRS